MSFMELTAERYSSRKYSSKPVEKEKIDAILEAGRLSPTAKNLQPVRVLVAETPESLGKLAKTANLYGAPVGRSSSRGPISRGPDPSIARTSATSTPASSRPR